MKIGYARVSTSEQTLNSQLDALKAAGVDRTFSEVASGAKTDRVQLAAALEFLREGDTLVILKFDRLGRSLSHLIEISDQLQQQGINLLSLTEGIDTGTPAGKLFFHLFGALAEFERDLIRERTYRGLAAARLRGNIGGRRQKLTNDQIAAMRIMSNNPQVSIATITKTFGISATTYYRCLKMPEGKREQHK